MQDPKLFDFERGSLLLPVFREFEATEIAGQTKRRTSFRKTDCCRISSPVSVPRFTPFPATASLFVIAREHRVLTLFADNEFPLLRSSVLLPGIPGTEGIVYLKYQKPVLRSMIRCGSVPPLRW